MGRGVVLVLVMREKRQERERERERKEEEKRKKKRGGDEEGKSCAHRIGETPRSVVGCGLPHNLHALELAIALEESR